MSSLPVLPTSRGGAGASPRRTAASSPRRQPPHTPTFIRIQEQFSGVSQALELALVVPTVAYVVSMLLWIVMGVDIEYARELGPLSFASLCVHIFVTAEDSKLTPCELWHFWLHASCEVLGAFDFTRAVGGSVWWVVLTSILMMIFWPVGRLRLEQLRIMLVHPSRTSQLPNVAEGALWLGMWLFIVSAYMTSQSISCMVYTGMTNCSVKNSGTRHVNYSLAVLYILFICFRHLNGISARQVMLFRLRPHQSSAVVLSFLTTMYSLYEYAASGVPYRSANVELSVDFAMFTCWFLGVTGLILRTPEVFTPPVLHLESVIKNTNHILEALEVAPDGVMDEAERKELMEGPLSREKGAMRHILRWAGVDEAQLLAINSPLSTGSDRLNPEEDQELGAQDGGESTLYIHPLLRYYLEHSKLPPWSFCATYLCEIVFFWRFMLFVFTFGYKVFLTFAAYVIINRRWAQMFTSLSTSALIVQWLLTLACDPRDRVSNQLMNLHFWFHALSEIPDVIVWIRSKDYARVAFNVIVLVCVWPWIFVAYKRVIASLREKYSHCATELAVAFFCEGAVLMAAEIFLAFQAHGCLMHLPPGREDECSNLIHANLISGMNLTMIFLVVRVLLFKLGGLNLTSVLHFELRPYELIVLSFSFLSGSTSLFFFANRINGVTIVSSAQDALEAATMICWIVACLLMAHKYNTEDEAYTNIQVSPTAGSDRYFPTSSPSLSPHADLELAQAALRRMSRVSPRRQRSRSPPQGQVDGKKFGPRPLSPRDDVALIWGDEQQQEKVTCRRRSCCCRGWDVFLRFMDPRNSETNIPFFRLLFFSATAIYLALTLAAAVDYAPRESATSVVGISFSCVCFHWLMSIEHPTSTMEVLHLLTHALAELISTLMWVQDRRWQQATYGLLTFFAVYPCLYHGIWALKLGLRRKFRDHLSLVRQTMDISVRSILLLILVLYLAFECIGCLHMKQPNECQALLYANTQVGISASLGFLVYLGLFVMQDVDARRCLGMELSLPQMIVGACSAVATILCTFSVASRHLSKLQTDWIEHTVEFFTIGFWYAALIILWVRRPWYDHGEIFFDGGWEGVELRLQSPRDATAALTAGGGAGLSALDRSAVGSEFDHHRVLSSSGARPRADSSGIQQRKHTLSASMPADWPLEPISTYGGGASGAAVVADFV